MKRRAPLAIAFVLSTVLSMTAGPRVGAQEAAVPALPPKDVPEPTDILSDRPDAEPRERAASDLLGPAFESKGNGISLCPPKDSVARRRVGSQDIIEFSNEKLGWTLKVTKIMLPQPGSLTEWRDSRGTPQPGVLEFTATRLKEEIPDAEFVRQEKINIADADVGMLALRYTRNLKDLLTQQAIIQRTDQMYYLLALTTPGAPKGSKEADALVKEGPAVETFRGVLDSVRMLDLRGVRADQDERLYRTRGLLLNFKPDRIKSALQKQRWNRVIKNGKDVGYAYVEERVDTKGAQEGVEVRVRSRMLPGNDIQVDTGSILFASMDMRHEDWSTLAERFSLKERAANPKEFRVPQFSETGISDRKTIPGRGDDYTLQVVYEGNAERVDPVNRELPPFYLPQAIAHLLPRLLTLNEPKTYMFMEYASEAREVMMRYVDVGALQKVTLNGKVVRAVPVQDRYGLEGPVTTHIMSPEGKWLGSESKDTGLTILPTDEETLLKLWKDANLTRPEGPADKKAAADADDAGTTVDAAAAAPAEDAPKPRSGKAPAAASKAGKRQPAGTGGNR